MAAAGAHVLVAVATAVVLAGCGGTSASLEDAADATAAETSRFEMTMRFSDASVKGAGELMATGAFDYPNERATIAVSGSFPFFGDEVLMREVRVLGRTTYLRWTVKGRSYWTKDTHDDEPSGDPNELLIPFPGSPTNPTDVLTRVLLASDENDEVGTEEIRGTETTHYRARVDLKKLVQQLPPRDRPDEDVMELWDGHFVPVELWIDEESRLRRITLEPPAGEDGDMTTVELFDYGVEVDVEPPPAEELTSEEEFDKLIEPLVDLEVGTGDSGEAAPEELCNWAREELPPEEAEELCTRPESMESP
jgi:hypothetical protein